MIKQVKLHSSYNPQKEAERFCDTIKTNPKIIVITEPGESYTAPILRKKFPEAKLIAMRYTDSYFLESDKLWDSVWRPAVGNPAFFLVNTVPDEFLPSTVFLSWRAAENVWMQSADSVWKAISEAIKIMQSIIATRNFFGKRWLKNINDNFIFTENILEGDFLKKIFAENTGSYFFAGAGPSLDIVLNNCREDVNKVFTTAAASALPALSSRNINLNLCISTDGGFWAGNHLKYLRETKFKETALAFPLEAKIPYEILKKTPCLFLNYGSAIESVFFKMLNIKPLTAKRNGTVSGTAIDLLLDNTEGKIFIAGLDLKESKGFSHCSPHESQKQKEMQANRTDPIPNFAAISNFDIRSLETYKKWFSLIPKTRADRLFRIGNEVLGNIRAISEDDFKIETFNQKNKEKETALKTFVHKTVNEKKGLLLNFYKNIISELENKIFFDKINFSLKEKNIEKELCEFISFQNYINFIKEKGTENEINVKFKLENEIKTFLKNQIERFKI